MVLTMKRLGSSHSRIHMSTQGLEKSSGGGMVPSFSPSSGDLLVSDEPSDVTLSPSTETSSWASDAASSFLFKKDYNKYFRHLALSVQFTLGTGSVSQYICSDQSINSCFRAK